MIRKIFQTITQMSNGYNPLNHAIVVQVLFCYPSVNKRPDHPLTAP